MVTLAASYVAGKWGGGTGEQFAVTSPATGEQIGTVGVAGAGDVTAAVAAAGSALASSSWGDTSPAERAAALSRLADALTARKGETSPIS